MAELTFDFKPQQKPLSWAVPHFGGKDLNKGLTLLNHRNNKMKFNKDKNKVLHFENKFEFSNSKQRKNVVFGKVPKHTSTQGKYFKKCIILHWKVWTI